MLRTTKISFPGLGIGEFSVDSTAFTVFGTPIAWYALIIATGMVLAVLYIMYRAGKIGIKSDEILDFAIFVIPIGIIGARLYYVLMEIEHYHSLKDVLNIREGGLAIYGGIIAGAITVFVICKIKKINFLAFADCVVPGLILAQAIGRWGNFMNGEAYGYETEIFCRMGLDFGLGFSYFHPTFLYESLWNILGFIAVNLYYRHKKFDGEIFMLVFGWYGLGRMWIEGLRTDSLYMSIFGLEFRVSQILAALILTACIAALTTLYIKRPNKPLYYREAKKERK